MNNAANRVQGTIDRELEYLLNPKSCLFHEKYTLDPDTYRHPKEVKAREDMLALFPCEDSILKYYREVEQGARLPDLIGKTVEVKPNQFSRVHNIVQEFSNVLRIIPPRVFIYENFYYRADTFGLDYQWIELTSSLARDFSEQELRFVLGRELAHIQSRHHYYEALAQSAVTVTEYIDQVPFLNIVSNGLHQNDVYRAFLKASINRWRRIACYTADACGFLLCSSIKACISALNKQILNNVELANEIELKDYLNSAKEIDRLNGIMPKNSKLDELIPYGPHRMLELLRFASSEEAKRAIAELWVEEEIYGK